MAFSEHDRTVLRRLAERFAEIASLPVQKQTAELWRRLNDLERVRPLVWANEIPWHEMDVGGELKVTCEDPFCQGVEIHLRRTIYQWEHMRGDMVIEPVLYSPLHVYDTGFGMREEVDVVRVDDRNPVVSRDYHPQITCEADVEKIKVPEVRYDDEATERDYERMLELVGDVVGVEKDRIRGTWFAPWDVLVTWWGVEEALADLVLRPELVHMAMDRLVTAMVTRFEQYEELNLLGRNDNNTRVGSGGYGYTNDLPQKDFDPARVRAMDIWGSATAQIFVGVSPEMHEEFALRYERRWLDKFGLTYYGCCEPLDAKVPILRSIPNLRKISMSPWINVERAVENVGNDYVFSYKPNPAIVAEHDWNPEIARRQMRSVLEKARGCVVEIIMKDISTVRYQPQRLWEWVQIAVEEAERVAS
jgi:hypothetical protein